MTDILPYIFLFLLIATSLGWMCFSDKIRSWINSTIS